MPGMFKRWFIEAPPAGLAALRIVVGGYALMYLLSRRRLLSRIAETDVDLFNPVGLASVLDAPMPATVFGITVFLTIVMGAAFVLGWGFRVSGPAFGGLLLFVLCYRNSWSMVYHTDNLLVFHVLILGFSSAADAVSVDGVMRRFVGRSRRTNLSLKGQSAEAWRYGFPIQLICAVTALTYFLAGIAKVTSPMGWAWVRGETVRDQVAVDVLRKHLFLDDTPLMAQFLFEHLWVFAVFGFVTLVVELGAPLAIVSRRFARPWVVVVFLMHWGILLVMGIKFRYQLAGVAFLPFVLRDFLSSGALGSKGLRELKGSTILPDAISNAKGHFSKSQ